MSDDQDGCEWVNVSSGTGHPGSPGQKAVKRLYVCVYVPHVIYQVCWPLVHVITFILRLVSCEQQIFD